MRRDILFDIKENNEPGIAKIEVYPPDNSGSVPVVVRQKSSHDPLEYIMNIINVIQTDFFDRIKTDIVKNGKIHLIKTDDPSIYRIRFSADGKPNAEKTDKIDL